MLSPPDSPSSLTQVDQDRIFCLLMAFVLVTALVFVAKFKCPFN